MTLAPLTSPAPASTPLAQWDAMQPARVCHIGVTGDMQARLCALGLVSGKVVQVLRRAALGDTLHLRVGSTEFMIRKNEATLIEVCAA